ncbi:MAG: cob(I)yrinic acid a,c-diamide adenosyltransferase [Anaerolineae bacterium]|nr:cob(I)yrinic acid a,c-diamide adenosyltransferase [Anaerolineae bacterium]
MSPYYTRGGDDGYTGLLGKGRYPKHDPRLDTIGSIDEVVSALGIARSLCSSPDVCQIILQVQRDLYKIMSEIAATEENAEKFRQVQSEQIAWLEQQIDALTQKVQFPGEFIVPGDTVAAAFMDQARTTTRRAERRLADLIHGGGVANRELLRYLNRLSSLCFVLELYENQTEGKGKPTLMRTVADKP